MKCTWIFCFIFGVSVIQVAEGEEHSQIYPSNLEFLQGAALSASEKIVTQLKFPTSQTFFILNVSPRQLDWIAEEALISILILKGYRVFKTSSVGDSTVTLSLRVNELCVTYREKHEKVERIARTKIIFSVTKGQANLVLFQGEGVGLAQDLVPKAQLPSLETSDITPIRLSKKEGTGRLVEPALLSAVVAGMIYFFYANKAVK